MKKKRGFLLVPLVFLLFGTFFYFETIFNKVEIEEDDFIPVTRDQKREQDGYSFQENLNNHFGHFKQFPDSDNVEFDSSSNILTIYPPDDYSEKYGRIAVDTLEIQVDGMEFYTDISHCEDKKATPTEWAMCYQASNNMTAYTILITQEGGDPIKLSAD